MAKRSKHHPQVQRTTGRQSNDPTGFRQRGLHSLQAGRPAEAIKFWSLLARNDPAVVPALAEAHFRYALIMTPGGEQIAELRMADELAPGQLRYAYQLALAEHRASHFAAAIKLYKDVLQRDPAWAGAGLALALAELEQNPRADISGLPGYSAEVGAQLAPVLALLRGEQPLARASALDQLWHGLGLLAAGDGAAAAELDDSRALPSERANNVRRYYKGVAAAQAGELDKALELWRKAAQPADSRPWLLENMATAELQRLEQTPTADATALINDGPRLLNLAAASPAFAEALVKTLDRAAGAAARRGEWAQAAPLWELARQAIGAAGGLGSPRPVLHNLALAYEAQEDWQNAAETWRAMLRTRPRRSGATAEQSGPSDEQWAWVRRRVIADYKQAGDPEAAVTVFRQAVKADPNDLDLRMELTEALVANEQERAAMNELERILKIDPQRVEAELRLAELEDSDGQWWQMSHRLDDLYKRYPEREDVRRAYVNHLLHRGEQMAQFGMFDQGTSAFAEGAVVAPDDYRFPLNQARITVRLGDMAATERFLTRTLDLAAGQIEPYSQTLDVWALAGKLDQVRAVLARAEAEQKPGPQFYVNAGVAILARTAPPQGSPFAILLGGPKPAPKEVDPAWGQLAGQLFDKALAARPGDAALRAHLAIELRDADPKLSLRFAEEAARIAPDDINVLMILSILLGLNERGREAKEQLRRAAKLARQQNNSELLQVIESLRQVVDTPLLRSVLDMGPLLGGFEEDDDDLFW